MHQELSFARVIAYIAQGVPITISVTLVGMVFAVSFALVFGIIQHKATGFRRFAATCVIEFWRSTPVVILLFAFYYSLPEFGVRLSGFVVGATILGLNTGAYGSQAVRSALQALPRGQIEAARSLGLGPMLSLVLVELPQAVRMMLPIAINLFIQMLKGTTLVSLVALSDMTFKARELSQLFYNPMKIYGSLLVAYVVIIYPTGALGRWMERRIVTPGASRR